MKITSPEQARKDSHPSTMKLEELGDAMSQLDLESVPEDKRPAAIMEHLGKIMSEKLIDKDHANDVHVARVLRANKRR